MYSTKVEERRKKRKERRKEEGGKEGRNSGPLAFSQIGHAHQFLSDTPLLTLPVPVEIWTHGSLIQSVVYGNVFSLYQYIHPLTDIS